MLISSKFCSNFNKNTIILPYMVGKNIDLYNGKNFVKVKINGLMVGYKLGEFILTRKMGKIHNLSKKKGGKGVSKKK